MTSFTNKHSLHVINYPEAKNQNPSFIYIRQSKPQTAKKIYLLLKKTAFLEEKISKPQMPKKTTANQHKTQIKTRHGCN